MARYADLPVPEDGKLAENIVHFARALRRAGVPVGPARVVDAIRAVEVAGFTKRVDFYNTLQACFVSKPEHLTIYGQVFRLFWRDPQFLEHMMAMMLPSVRGVQDEQMAQAAERRAAEALLDGTEPPPEIEEEEEGEQIEIDASLSFSNREKLQTLDFEQMSVDETAQAKRAIAQLDLPVRPFASRRMKPDARGRVIDFRKTLQNSMRRGGEFQKLEFKTPKQRWPNLVALCDISGSMSSYSRILMHFLHSAARQKGDGWARVHTFTFGTRLTNVSHQLRARDVDAALKAVGQEAQDWEGGTRIGDCIQAFNRDWSRRVLGQGAVVLLITDGLDRGDPDLLAKQAQRLRLSCRKLIWLNPLLRWDAFEAKAQGVRALLPEVDSFRACHNLASLEQLSQVLSQPDDQGDKLRLMGMMQ